MGSASRAAGIAGSALSSLVLALVLCLLVAAGRGGAAEGANPFRQLISDRDYETEKQQLERRIKKAGELTVRGMPLDGAEMVSAPSGGPAMEAGLRLEDVIFRAGRWEVWGGQPMLRDRNRKQQIFAMRPEGGAKLAYWAEPGGLGFRTRIYNRMEVAYLRGTSNRSPEWDRDLVAAMVAWRSDPAFAETAWHFAVKRGAKVDRLGAYFAAVFRAQRPDESGQVDAAIKEFVRHFESIEKIPTVFMTGLVPLLAAHGRLDDLAALSNVRSPNFPWFPKALEQMQEWRSGDGPPSPSLLDKSGEGKGKDITQELVSFVGGAAKGAFKVEATEHAGANQFKLNTFGVDRPLKNAHLRWVFQVESLTQPEGRPAAMRLAIIRSDASGSRPPLRYPAIPPFHDVRLVAAALLGESDEGDPRMELSSSGIEGAWLLWTRDLAFPKPNVFVLRTELDRPDADLSASRTNHLDLVRIDGEVGVWLNGAPCLQLPVDPSIDDVRFHLHLSGAILKTQEFKVTELP